MVSSTLQTLYKRSLVTWFWNTGLARVQLPNSKKKKQKQGKWFLQDSFVQCLSQNSESVIPASDFYTPDNSSSFNAALESTAQNLSLEFTLESAVEAMTMRVSLMPLELKHHSLL
ncbi:hypothetical protein NC652_004625 [Populus alba x Populus x berolinensis]|nr:hypothetical protein NC652_004625 [Populus alba x Populus x berolinensis]